MATTPTSAAAAAALTSTTCKTWRPKPSSSEFQFRNPTTRPSPIITVSRDRSALSFITRAAVPPPPDNQEQEEEEERDDDDDGIAKGKQPSVSSSPMMTIRLDDVNPVGLGRRSRQIFDQVWRKFSGLGQISRTTRADDEMSLLMNESGPMCEFAIPGAQNTTVLVVGATSRVGRIVVRKLMLRGYSVKDYNNKLAQLRAGKSSKSKLLLAKFRSQDSLNGWLVRQGTYFQDVVAAKYDGGMNATFEFTEDGHAVFSGYVFTRGGFVELSKKLSLPLGSTLDRYEGIILSVGGNGRSYVLILEAGPSADTTQSKMYFARFSTKVGFCRVRIPFSSFRPVKPDDPPLDPFLVHTLTIRFEPRRQRPIEGPSGSKQDLRSFKFVVEYIKALPAGQETDFILVSCTGLGIEPTRREQVLRAKKAGEDSLRRSGLGYTIIRPGPLKEEPGGQRALIFDQGNRISQGISCADVADICVKALHDSTARNKSFDVCYEYVAEPGKELYELVAHLPDKANNYLTPALSVLEKNT
ncbi:protein HIGH CHLOROPHYLL FLUORESCENCE PHENOTYPE 173, chloroplastic isoform X2 [Diospyros lotus]|uniref:protein HIGH CHLOROPHYLL FLUORESCENCE PHENOTYPE 173, chloroplastic isoform X2 n=1 Tax=Diospyros lotus TaxID=55363 RepID=UPI002254F85D|nr:protein HIGH CHLOROPHYLL FLUORESCENCE PHENOTYPE 173, chloroplastic isoform X2 [Diospyros lotus]